MSNRYHRDIESYIDSSEEDIPLRCINWCVDIYVFMDMLPEAIRAKWSRVNYLLGVR